MMANTYLLLILVVWICTVAAYSGDDLPPGPYCGGSGVNGGHQCCENRQDGCSHQIKDTRCYCDEFCNRPNSHDDCCPDYIDVCHKDWAPPPAPFVKKECYLHGKKYLEGKSAMIDCNMRTCIYDERENITKWADDEKDECIISKGVINGVRNRLTWRATNYTEFASKKLKDGLIKKLGTLPLSPSIKRLVPIRYDKDIDYPANFDARTHWPGYISPVIDQGWCGSDWAVALAGVTSDRFAIQSNGAENMILSPQTLLSCNVRNQKGCDGGHVDVAWNFARNYGLMPENCFPYKANKTKCPFTKTSTLQQHQCYPSYEARTSKYKVGPVGRLVKEQDIMYDILHSGPVFAVMTVYQDFFHYRDGIYRHSQFGDNQMKGLHSVRIVGWGEGSGDKYWLVANSWGQEWGENGYFRIARGRNESGIESFVLTALSEVEVSQKK